MQASERALFLKILVFREITTIIREQEHINPLTSGLGLGLRPRQVVKNINFVINRMLGLENSNIDKLLDIR